MSTIKDYVVRLVQSVHSNQQSHFSPLLMATRYDLRSKDRKNYKELSEVKLPRSQHRIQRDTTLYELEIVEEDVYTNRVKVHYIGYESDDDEWRDRTEIVTLKHKKEPDIVGKLKINPARFY